jgi:phosphoribosylaminoimidazole carboxylase
VAAEARRVAALAVEALGGDYGVFGVELFLLADGTVLLNEVAPRPHNSGHYTIEACEVSQFHNHLRAACRLPLGSTALSCGAALMVNVLGDGDDAATRGALDAWLAVEGASPHWYGKAPAKKGRKMGHVTVVAPSLAALRKRVAAGPDPSLVDTLLGGAAAAPVVGIIMGSTSDLGTMKAAAEVLDALDVPYELTIVSAHRTPARLAEYAASAERRGLSVIVAGAGGAAHLPGMVAAQTALPVVGVPVKTSTLSGVDSLYSIVQMPKGIPVATVAIGNACNAGLLAARILGVADLGLRARLKAYAAAHEAEVLEKAEKVEALGWKGYLDATGGGSGVVDV